MTLLSDVIQGAGPTTAAVANQVDLGDITLPQSARMITRVWATGAIVGTFAAAQTLTGYVKLESEDCNIQPFQFPLEPISGYVTLGGGGVGPAHKWGVNCPCAGGSVIHVYVVADDAVAASEIQVTIEFSDGGSPWGGPQYHMVAGEPSVAAGTADDGAVSLTNIEIKAARLHGVAIYGAQATLTADCSFVATFEITSDDFAVAGPFKSSINPHLGGDTNTTGSLIALTVIETDRAFRYANQKQTVSCVATVRDAMAGNGHYNWCLIYS
jgi:hypothetical protein